MTIDDIIRMAREAGLNAPGHPFNPWSASQDALERFAALVAAAEREACAKLCETTNDGTPYNLAEDCAAAIRSKA